MSEIKRPRRLAEAQHQPPGHQQDDDLDMEFDYGETDIPTTTSSTWFTPSVSTSSSTTTASAASAITTTCTPAVSLAQRGYTELTVSSSCLATATTPSSAVLTSLGASGMQGQQPSALVHPNLAASSTTASVWANGNTSSLAGPAVAVVTPLIPQPACPPATFAPVVSATPSSKVCWDTPGSHSLWETVDKVKSLSHAHQLPVIISCDGRQVSLCFHSSIVPTAVLMELYTRAAESTPAATVAAPPVPAAVVATPLSTVIPTAPMPTVAGPTSVPVAATSHVPVPSTPSVPAVVTPSVPAVATPSVPAVATPSVPAVATPSRPAVTPPPVSFVATHTPTGAPANPTVAIATPTPVTGLVAPMEMPRDISPAALSPSRSGIYAPLEDNLRVGVDRCRRQIIQNEPLTEAIRHTFLLSTNVESTSKEADRAFHVSSKLEKFAGERGWPWREDGLSENSASHSVHVFIKQIEDTLDPLGQPWFHLWTTVLRLCLTGAAATLIRGLEGKMRHLPHQVQYDVAKNLLLKTYTPGDLELVTHEQLKAIQQLEDETFDQYCNRFNDLLFRLPHDHHLRIERADRQLRNYFQAGLHSRMQGAYAATIAANARDPQATLTLASTMAEMAVHVLANSSLDPRYGTNVETHHYA